MLGSRCRNPPQSGRRTTSRDRTSTSRECLQRERDVGGLGELGLDEFLPFLSHSRSTSRRRRSVRLPARRRPELGPCGGPCPLNGGGGRLWPDLGRRGDAEAVVGRSANAFRLLGSRNAARPGLGLGLWQESEARLTPREVDVHIEQSVRTSAWAAEFHHPDDTVGLSGSERHRPSRGMVWGGVDAKNQIARADGVAHSFDPLALGKE
jgi:hypothetical protein